MIKHWTRFDPGQSLKVVNSPIKDAKRCSNRVLVDFQPSSLVHIHNGCARLCIDGDFWELSCQDQGCYERFFFVFF